MIDALVESPAELSVRVAELSARVPGGKSGDARALLVAVGALVVRGAEPPPVPSETSKALRGLLDEALALAALEGLAVELAALVEDTGDPQDDDDEGAEDEDPEATRDAVALLLGVRTEAELAMIGVERLLGDDVARSVEGETARLACDGLLEELTWRLTQWNSVRADLLHPIAAPFRERFPWLRDGVSIPEDSVGALSGVAQLVGRFPGARAVFDGELALSAAISRAAAGAGAMGRIVDLRSYLESRRTRRSPGFAAQEPGVRVAASPRGDEPLLLLEDAACAVSLRPPTEIVIDVLAPEDLLGLPRIVLDGSREMVAAAVPDMVGRYEARLDEAALGARSVEVVLDLRGAGTQRTRLLPEDPEEA